MAQTAQILFHHPVVGDLVIDNGLDDVEWTYGLNTQVFPTYGGEVVQILSVYIDDIKFLGCCATYAQMEAIYTYFTNFLQVATQGANGTPVNNDTGTGTAYNLFPVSFTYPARDWYFRIYPKNVPGFHYGTEVVMPQWQLSAFVVDDSPDLSLIKNGLAALAVANDIVPHGSEDQITVNEKTAQLFHIGHDISPLYGDPNLNPFETFDPSVISADNQIKQYSDYYSSLIPFWLQGDLSSLVSGIGSRPVVTPDINQRSASGANQQVQSIPGAGKAGVGKTPPTTPPISTTNKRRH